ncbi:MAG: phage tail protein, partial [Cellvibrio sp.]|nr:phage tail protein [Cellvibrio sp.]
MNISSFITGGGNWGTLTTLHGVVAGDRTQFTVAGGDNLNDGVVTDITFYLSALAAVPSSAGTVAIQRNFDLDVLSGGANGSVVYSYGNLSTAPEGAGSLASVLTVSPAK